MSDVQQQAPEAKGGTELICANLKKSLPELTDQVQIIMSRPEQVTLEDKPRILWLQDLPQDPASQCLRDPLYRQQFNRIVFASHWQQQMYNKYLGIPYAHGTVIRNGVPDIEPTTKDYSDKIRFVYTSTPHRGLGVLAAAVGELAKQRQDFQLDVYSSLKIYGWGDADKQFEPLYEILKNNPCVNYHGSQPNAVVRQAVQNGHVFVYPSIYEETSCMAIQEAMMAGCVAITSNFGALPETCGAWAWMFPFDERPDVMAQQTFNHMNHAIDYLKKEDNREAAQQTLQLQSMYFRRFYSFESRIPTWKNLLEQVIAEGVPEQKLIIET